MTHPTADAGLTAGQRALLGAVLTQRRAELDRLLAAQQEGDSRVAHAAELLQQDGDDAPQRDADREVDLARNDQRLQELGAVSQALQRLQAPDFGQCSDCGGPIAFDRLKLAPWVRHCVACEGAREQRGGAAGLARPQARPHQI